MLPVSAAPQNVRQIPSMKCYATLNSYGCLTFFIVNPKYLYSFEQSVRNVLFCTIKSVIAF